MFKTRSVARILRAPLDARNYVALWQMARTYPAFPDAFRRYVLAAGNYPCPIRIRTPTGEITPTLFCQDDILTANEIFCRLDYRTDRDIEVVADIGANIGLSVLYFLTRNPRVRVYAYEPVPENLAKLETNLAPFAERVTITPVALGDREGPRAFVMEPTGRYCGFQEGRAENFPGTVTTISCRRVDAELDKILEKEGRIDLLKVDAEGAEQEIIRAIRPDQRARIRAIVYEAKGGVARIAPQEQPAA
jgi:FkbM family methyltransferase